MSEAVLQFQSLPMEDKILKQEKKQKMKTVPALAESAAVRNGRLHTILAILVCLALPLIIYSNSLDAPFILDDIGKIVENPDIRSLNEIGKKLIFQYEKERTIYQNDPSRPVTYLSFALNYYFGGLNAFGYHLVNVLIHSFNTVLVFFFARKVFGYSLIAESLNRSITSLLVALLFAVHPVNSNVVNYTFSRSDSLAALFYIASILLFLKSIEKSKLLLIFSLLSFFLAIFSKQLAVTLPAVIFLIDFIFLSNFKFREARKRIAYHLPFWLLLFAYLVFRYFYFGGIGDLEAEELIGRYSYLITQPYAILRYFQMLFVPVGLCIDHAVVPANSVLDLRVWGSILVLVAIIGFSIYKAYKAGGEFFKVILFSLLYFFVIVSPTSSIFPTTSVLVENRTYLSGIGFFIMLGSAYYSLIGIRQTDNNSWFQRQTLFFPLIILGLFCFLTGRRNELYKKPAFLWEEVLTKYPNHFRAYNNLGIIYLDGKEYSRAESLFKKAIALNPGIADSYSNLGNIYYYQNNFEKALVLYQKAIEMRSKDARTYYNLGNVYLKQDRLDDALKCYQEALQLKPEYAEVYHHLGLLYFRRKMFVHAEHLFQKAIELKSDFAECYSNLGNLYYAQGKHDESIRFYQKALELNPQIGEARLNLARMYFLEKRYLNSLKECEIALELLPDKQQYILEKIRLLKKLVRDSKSS